MKNPIAKPSTNVITNEEVVASMWLYMRSTLINLLDSQADIVTG
jgi:hypothetical protein